MPNIGRSGKLYQERRQPEFQATLRGPGPQIYFPDNLVHRLPLEPPFPNPQYQQSNNGTPVPDAGRTQAWPHGDKHSAS